MAYPSKVLSLLDSGIYSSSMSGLGNAFSVIAPFAASFQLGITAAPASSTFASATLDVQVLHSLDGTNYDSFLRFPQVVSGAAAVGGTIATWNGALAASSSMVFHTRSTSTLAASSVLNGPIGSMWKVAYTIANGPSSTQVGPFTFSVSSNVFHQS